MRTTLLSGCPVEIVRPSGTPTRGVVIAIDIWGLRALFDDMCTGLSAANNSAVAAVEPFPLLTDLPQEMDARMAAANSLHDEDVMANLGEAAEMLGTDKTAVMGFCMGDMNAMKAASVEKFDNAVAFYGHIRVPAMWKADKIPPLRPTRLKSCEPSTVIPK